MACALSRPAGHRRRGRARSEHRPRRRARTVWAESPAAARPPQPRLIQPATRRCRFAKPALRHPAPLLANGQALHPRDAKLCFQEKAHAWIPELVQRLHRCARLGTQGEVEWPKLQDEHAPNLLRDKHGLHRRAVGGIWTGHTGLIPKIDLHQQLYEYTEQWGASANPMRAPTMPQFHIYGILASWSHD